MAARSLYLAIPANVMLIPPAFAGMMLAASAYAFTNHALVGLAVVLARGVRWRDSGALDCVNIQSDMILLLLGSVVAGLWMSNPWFIVPALSPLLLIRQALTVPMLKEGASTGPKTGLANARHFAKLNGRNCVVCAADVPESVQQGMTTMPMDRLDRMSHHKYVPRPDDTGTGPDQAGAAPAVPASGTNTLSQ